MTTPAALLTAADPDLGRWIALVGDCRLQIDGTRSLYEALARAVVYQQLTGKAAATIHGRVTALGDGGFPSPEALLALDDAQLRGAGLSGGKTAALRDLAARTLRGEVPTIDEAAELDDEALVQRLLPIRGVGRWTVEMLLLFRLGRPDVLPLGDYGVKKGFQRAFGTPELPTPAELAARGERWRPHRSVASWYLWRVCELPAGVAP
jgi:DNA-3-methyladenine glycosylase II